MPKDAQVVLEEPSEDAMTYVHYFTLFDVHARGFVRPMCASYVTHDRDKCMDFFFDLQREFNKVHIRGRCNGGRRTGTLTLCTVGARNRAGRGSQVTHHMKSGNRQLFYTDLQHRIADLTYTMRVLQGAEAMAAKLTTDPTLVWPPGFDPDRVRAASGPVASDWGCDRRRRMAPRAALHAAWAAAGLEHDRQAD